MAGLFLDRNDALRSGWRALFFYVTVTIGYGFTNWALRNAPRAAHPLGLCAVLLLASWLFLALEGRPLASLGLRPGRAWSLDYGQGLLAGVAVMAATAALLFAAGGFRLARTPACGPLALGTGALFYLVPAVNEELAFRGYLFQRLEGGLGSWGSLAAMSLLFAAAHLGNPGMAGGIAAVAFLNIFLAGVLLGLARLGTRSLALPMGLHLGWNWAQGTLLGFGVSGTAARGFFTPLPGLRPLWLTGGAVGLEGSPFCTLICLLACLLCFLRFKSTLLFTAKKG